MSLGTIGLALWAVPLAAAFLGVVVEVRRYRTRIRPKRPVR